MRTCERLVQSSNFHPHQPVELLAGSYYELLEHKKPILGMWSATVNWRIPNWEPVINSLIACFTTKCCLHRSSIYCDGRDNLLDKSHTSAINISTFIAACLSFRLLTIRIFLNASHCERVERCHMTEKLASKLFPTQRKVTFWETWFRDRLKIVSTRKCNCRDVNRMRFVYFFTRDRSLVVHFECIAFTL